MSEQNIPGPNENAKNLVEFNIGLGLAVSSSIFIGSSFVVKKLSLNRLSTAGGLRAGQGGFGYLKDWMWWLGLLSMGVGEFANFAAYAFAPASLVTPLGALSVLVSAILSARYLKESLNLLGKLGCLLCVLGSTIIVIHSPKEEQVESLSVLLEKLQDASFIYYTLIVIAISVTIAFYIGPKYGHCNVAVYVALCSAVGSLTVMSCKGLGLAIKETFSGKTNNFEHLITYVFFFTVVICVFIQMNYLNKALDLFSASVVTPIYYVFFTTLVIIASAILFKEWGQMSPEDVLGNLCGFLVIIVAVVLLQAFKDVDVTMDHVRGILQPKYHDPLVRMDDGYSYGSRDFFVRSV